MKEKNSGNDIENLLVAKMIFEEDKIIISYTFDESDGDVFESSYIMELI